MLQALSYAAKGGVAAIQMRGYAGHDKELRAGGIGAHAARHGQYARRMLDGIGHAVALKLAADGIAGATHAGALRIAALDHEIRNDAMKNQPVIEAAVGQGDEVAHGLGRVLGIQLALHHRAVLHGDYKRGMKIILHGSVLQFLIV